MKKILSLFAVLLFSAGLLVSDAQTAKAGSGRNAAIAGAVIGGLVVGAAVANHNRRHRRHYRRHHRSYYAGQSCHRKTRCRWRRARRWWSHGVRHYRPARRVCRRVRVCH